jgi:hypothetical protein
MAISDLDLGWALRKVEEATLALNEAKTSPDSLRKYLVIRAIVNAKDSIAQILGIQELDQRLLLRVGAKAPWENVGIIKVFDSVIDFLQKNDVDPNTALNLGALLVSTAKNIVSSVQSIHIGGSD